MPEKPTEITAAYQIEHTVRQLDCLAMLPAVAGRLLSAIFEEQDSADLPDIIQSDSVLLARVFATLGAEMPAFGGNVSPAEAMRQMPRQTLRDSVFSVEIAPEDQDQGGIDRRGLMLHSIGVACWARQLAMNSKVRIDPEMAYAAGILHDIGKLALEEVMPRSYEHIIEQAKEEKDLSCAIEQRYLGTDHTILGKRLGQKWNFPEEITTAIWLHHADLSALPKTRAGINLAQVVNLADNAAKSQGIGESGSFDAGEISANYLKSLQISEQAIEKLDKEHAELLRKTRELLGLQEPAAEMQYPRSIQSVAIKLARENSQLSGRSQKLEKMARHFGFLKDFLGSVNIGSEPIDVAKQFALGWKKFYQTGPVCLYFPAADESGGVETVVVEGQENVRTALMDGPAQGSIIPEKIRTAFDIIRPGGECSWLFEQLDIDIDLTRVQMVPLLCHGRAVGCMIFEFRLPTDPGKAGREFETITSAAGTILAMALSFTDQQRFAEKFAQTRVAPARIPSPSRESGQGAPEAEKIAGDLTDTLAEIAAGAAHELNNSLSVISGRTQQLSSEEEDKEKTRILGQIQENTKHISRISDDLMSYARPEEPLAAEVSLAQIIDEATHLAAQRKGLDRLDVSFEPAEDVNTVFVDSGQLVSAVANIFTNALESYGEGSGPIKVTAEEATDADSIAVRIRDWGSGMDDDVRAKAFAPFFSAKPAGRQRGMGLAHARRLTEINHGHISLESQTGQGTTVTILLPGKKK